MISDLKLELERLKRLGRLRDFAPVRDRKDVSLTLRGRKVIDFSNWDLFRLNEHPRVISAVHRELEHWGLGGSAPRLSSGTGPQHLLLEARIARFFGVESAVLFVSRNQAVLSLLTALCNERTIVFVDEAMQSPVADAAYVVNAPIVTFNATVLDTLDSELAKAPEGFSRYIFAETISPLRGTPTDLAARSCMARK